MWRGRQTIKLFTEILTVIAPRTQLNLHQKFQRNLI